MEKIINYAYGEHCCLCVVKNYNLTQIVKKAYNEGYGFIVRCSESAVKVRKRTILAWNVSFGDLEKLKKKFAKDKDILRMLESYYSKGVRLFVVAPTKDGPNIFPFNEFERLEIIPNEKLNDFLS